jgi:dihydroorotate dehydrogenase (NAD+) catalytic subunit
MTASGTFGYGTEYADFIDLGRLGGIFVKGTTLAPGKAMITPGWPKHPQGCLMRSVFRIKEWIICRTPLSRHKGLRHPYDRECIGIYRGGLCRLCGKLADLDKMPAIELNISCPNVKEGGMAFGTSCQSAAQVTREVRKVFPKTLIVKLSPNVTDVTEIARGVEDEGADAVSLVNTFLGMAIDVESRRPKLSTITGGLSGPCIKPIAIRMVWEVFHAVKIPIIGMGGICNWQDAIEFILAGATAVQIGTYNFIDPAASVKIIDGIHDYLERHQIASVNDLVGK